MLDPLIHRETLYVNHLRELRWICSLATGGCKGALTCRERQTQTPGPIWDRAFGFGLFRSTLADRGIRLRVEEVQLV
jgi:hypothetical protein